jgi:hypothetical protein
MAIQNPLTCQCKLPMQVRDYNLTPADAAPAVLQNCSAGRFWRIGLLEPGNGGFWRVLPPPRLSSQLQQRDNYGRCTAFSILGLRPPHAPSPVAQQGLRPQIKINYSGTMPRSTWRNAHAMCKGETTRNPVCNLPRSSCEKMRGDSGQTRI